MRLSPRVHRKRESLHPSTDLRRPRALPPAADIQPAHRQAASRSCASTLRPCRIGLACGLLAHGYRLFYSTVIPKPLALEPLKKLAADMSQSNTFLSCVYCFLFLFGGKEVNMVMLPIAVTGLFQAMTVGVRADDSSGPAHSCAAPPA